jgi:LacI family transcriptional regulator, galactose operon repressor
MATIRDVAELAGCSTATVSRFFNQKPVSPALQRRVMAAIEALAFSPNVVARNLKLKRSMMLGMIIPDISEPFFPAVVKGVEAVARARDYSLMLFNTQEDAELEAKCVDILAAHQCDGIILIKANGVDEERFRDKLAKLPLPIVYLDRAPDSARDAVVIDNVTGARRGVEHLLRLGHRDIAIVLMPPTISTHHDRLEGYRMALRDYGVEVRPEYVAQTESGVPDAYSVTLQLLTSPKPPTAIFATNARLTVGVMAAVQSRGLHCPKDISVLGHDGFDWQDVFHPRLTIVEQPADLLGRKAAELLIQRVTGALDGPPRRVVLNPDLVIRESCGVYRGHDGPPSDRVPAS